MFAFLPLILLSIWCAWATESFAHSWYDADCCSEQDCYEVPDEDVVEIEDGKWKHLPTGAVFERRKVRPSKDGHFHVCIHPKLGPQCIYIVQGS